MYFIWSFEHGAWWKPDRQGYTTNLSEAGRYEAGEAGDIMVADVEMNEVAVQENVLRNWHDSKPPKFHPYNGAVENDEA